MKDIAIRFADAFHADIFSYQAALVALYERKDKLQYVTGPELERRYIEIFGDEEETVIKAEIECELLREKQKRIQAAINRKEDVDEAAIDAALEEERKRKFEEAEGAYQAATFAELSEEESRQLQDLYHKIVKAFHPATNPDNSETDTYLYERALEAYQRRNVKSLQMIHDMLFQQDELIDDAWKRLALLNKAATDVEEEKAEKEEENQTEKRIIPDYTLALQIHPFFVATSGEKVLKGEAQHYRDLMKEQEAEIAKILSSFPHTAAKTIEDEGEIAAYKAELAVRLRNAVKEQQRRKEEIRQMLKKEAVQDLVNIIDSQIR